MNKVINPIITNTYSCFHCQKNFDSEKELSVFWFCSPAHEFKYAYGFVDRAFPKAKKYKKVAFANRIVEVSLR